jgi:hypothetical protein
VDQEFDAVLISGYFGQREGAWREPIYRNVWSLLTEFGDADLASLVAPRPLIIEAAAPPLVDGPPAPHDGRSGVAAPGRIEVPASDGVQREFEAARTHYANLDRPLRITLVDTQDRRGAPGSDEALRALMHEVGLDSLEPAGAPISQPVDSATKNETRQRRQVRELVDYTQKLLDRSDKVRDKLWASVDRSSVDKCVASLEPYRDMVYDQMIGRLPEPTVP